MIEQNKELGIIHISAPGSSYLISTEKGIRNLYWGAPVDIKDAGCLVALTHHSSFDDDIQIEREEYPLWNGHNFCLPCVKTANDNPRAFFTEYKGCEIENGDEISKLIINLEDTGGRYKVQLIYTVYEQYGIIARSSKITANTDLQLETAMSASVSLPEGQQCEARWLAGKWGAESHIQEQKISTGILTLQSRKGIPGPHFNPSIALSETDASEQSGKVWFGLLGYSGNWAIHVEQTIYANTHIVAGINNFDYIQNISKGESFTTPPFYIGFTGNGFGDMSRTLHRFERQYILPKTKLRPVLYNSWEATTFDVTAKGQKALAKKAADIGCELFVVDDGWFGERHSDRAGLGDWWVNKQKFPQGLEELISYVKGLGMEFGIWVEPEAVNPDSDLYREHPDWIYRYPDSEPMQLRNQYLLNLSIPEVQAYLKNMLYQLLAKNDISFIKWDMNRVITDMQSMLGGCPREMWYNHVKALYGMWEFVRESFPDLDMETCSGGGARIDLGILQYAEQSWPSDNTDPYTRLTIQEGYTLFYPPAAMVCWVTNSPGGKEWAERSLEYRFHSSMCGALGVGSDITVYTQEDIEECAKYIAQYKNWRHIIQHGDLHRLSSPRKGWQTAIEYISYSRDEVLVFVFTGAQRTYDIPPRVYLEGLDPDAEYQLENGSVYTGKTLMNAGLFTHKKGDFQSLAWYFKKV